MSAEGRSAANDRITAELVAMSDFELMMMLADWKRWRAHVQSAPVMRLRRERFDEATAYIEAIQLELALRQPGERLARRRQAASRQREVTAAATVSLAAYREVRRDLARLEQRRR